MTAVKEQVCAFVKTYTIEQATLEKLETVLSEMGYRLIAFNPYDNPPAVEAIIDTLSLSEAVRTYQAFTCWDCGHKLVFISALVSPAEKLALLAHEIGHIYCGHMDSRITAHTALHCEQEANAFSFLLLYPTLPQRICRFVQVRRKACAIWALTLTLIAALCVGGVYFVHETAYAGQYYVTSSGEKYHRKDCFYIRDKTNLRRLTKEELQSGTYAPCKVCIPK